MRIIHKVFFSSLLALAFAVGNDLNQPQTASALSGSDFNPGNIIDDALFFDGDTMDVGQIQNFLNSKVPACDTWGTQMYNSTQTRAQYSASRGYPAPFTCLRDYRQDTGYKGGASGLCSAIEAKTNRSAAEIIDDVARACHVSEKVILVMLQKEQGLVTDDWPWSIQFRSAMGYGCPDTAACDSQYYGFFNQVYNAALQFQRYKADPTYWNHVPFMNNQVLYQANAPSCGSRTVYIENYATAGLYNYTPYTPNAPALSNLYGTGDSCSAYGNRNFWRYYNDWFGSTSAFIHNGISYSPVFNPEYYLNNNLDIKNVYGTNHQAAFKHFVEKGMAEGRVAHEIFNVHSYRNRYADIRWELGTNLTRYYWHFAAIGKKENRIATGEFTLQPVTTLGGVDYSSVYDFNSYVNMNMDVKSVYGNSDTEALWHFVNHGMNEGRQGVETFNLSSYKNRYYDLRNTFGSNDRIYYIHYLKGGKSEGRIATGDYWGGTTTSGGVEYASLYEFNYYAMNNSDIKKAFGLNDMGALNHFITYGMQEGRQGSDQFNVYIYKNRYPDLQAAYGDNLKSYSMHYIKYGRGEGRSGL